MDRQRYAVAEGVLSREVDGEKILLHLPTYLYFGLDEIGSALWAGLVAGKGRQEIEHDLLEDYSVDPKVLRADLDHLMAQLVDRGLVVSLIG